MPSTDRGIAGWLAALAVIGGVAAGAGIPVRASYGAQVTADEPQYLLTALSIAEDGNLDIADELADRRWRDFHEAQLPEQTKPLDGGRRISPHDPLLPLLLSAPMALGGWVGAKAALAAMAAALAVLLGWTAIRRFSVAPPVAVGVIGWFAASAPLASYGHQIYPEVPAALAVTVAVAALTGPLHRAGCWTLTAAVIALPWLAVKYAPVAATLAALGLYRLWRKGRRGAAVGVIVAGACAAVVFAIAHLAVWGGLTPYASGDHFVGGEFTVVGNAPNYLGRSQRLLGLVVDRHFGIAAWQPAWLLLVPAVAFLLRRRTRNCEVLLAPLAVGWLTATFVALTMHGYWAPGRQVVVVLPAAVLAITVVAARSRVMRTAVATLGALGVWSYAWLVVAGRRGQLTWIVDFFDTPDPWYRLWSRALPAYANPTAATWVLHGIWLTAAAVTVVLVWRYSEDASVAGASVVDADPETEPDADPDADPPSSMVRTPVPSSDPHAESAKTATKNTPTRRRDRERDDTGNSLGLG